jgi:hypothetical protein
MISAINYLDSVQEVEVRQVSVRMSAIMGVAGLACVYSSLSLNSGSGIIISLTFLNLHSNDNLFFIRILKKFNHV